MIADIAQGISPELTSMGQLQNEGNFSPFAPKATNLGEVGSNQAQVEKMLQNLSMTELGRLQLTHRLTKEFGDNYHTNPQAQAMMKTFEESLAKTPDLSSLQKLIDQGQRVEDYLSSISTLGPGRSQSRLI